MSAAMWKVMTQRDVTQYGRVEEFITSLLDSVPALLTYRHYAKLALGLRSRLILELCRRPEAPDRKVILSHLERVVALMQSAPNKQRKDLKVEMAVRNFQNLVPILLDDPEERELFFQEDFPEQYGAQFDKALEKLMWELLIRLDQLLPVPDLAQTVSWLGNTPPVLDECGKLANQPQVLRTLLQHEICLGHTGSAASLLPTTGDVILSSLSLPPSGQLQETHQQRQETHHQGSGETCAGTRADFPSPPKSRLRRTRRTRSPIAPVIGSISLRDIQSAGTGARVEEERSGQPRVTLRSDGEEPSAAPQAFTQIKPRTRSKPVKAAVEEDTPVQGQDEPHRVVREDSKAPRKRGRPRKSRAPQGQELKNKCDEKGRDWTSLLRSCQERQLRVVVRRLDTTEAMRSRDSGDTDASRERDDSATAAAMRSCSARQLRVIVQRLDVSSPAIQALLNRPPAAASKERRVSLSTKTRRHVTVRKRKRKDSSSSPEKTLLSSKDKE
ncbi:hypothetical protein ACEWY4_025259 [Coilia grayii]|uniref:TERF1-interacting nuclear factor 2 N-terminal domain-containing protein n=1 Tax=Coilia grayii TaxID=363190 RepID=A0ABD1IZP5_9TELE